MNKDDEKFLREAIRREIRKSHLNEDVSASAADVKDVWEAIKRVFSVTKIAIKSVISGLVVNVQLMFTVDPQKVTQYVQEYKSRQMSILREYEQELAPVRELLSGFEPILFMTAPGAYLASKAISEGPAIVNEISEYLREAGIELDPNRPQGSAFDDSDSFFQKQILNSIGVTPTETSRPDMNDFKQTSDAIKKKLDDIFGVISTAPVRESKLLREAKIPDDDQIFQAIVDVLKNIKPEDLGFKPEAVEKMAKVKVDEANKFSSILMTPQKFITALGSAKSMSDAQKAVKMLEGTPFAISGLDKLTPESVESVAKAEVSKLKTDQQKTDLITEANPSAKIEGPITDKMLIDAARSIALKRTLAKAVIESESKLPDAVEDLRKTLMKQYAGDIDVENLKKFDPDSPVVKAVEEGTKKIKESGILQKKAAQ